MFSEEKVNLLWPFQYSVIWFTFHDTSPNLPCLNLWLEQPVKMENTEKVSTILCKFPREVIFPCGYMLFMTKWHKKNVGKNIFILYEQNKGKCYSDYQHICICVCITLNVRETLLIKTVQQQLWNSRRKQDQTIFSISFEIFSKLAPSDILSLEIPHIMIFLKQAPTVG